MENVTDKRDKKNELLARKVTLNNLIREHVRNNINKLKRVIYNQNYIPIHIAPNWMDLVVTSRLASWISQSQEMSKIQMLRENVYNENFTVKIRDTEDLHRALTVYTLARDLITTDRERTKGTFIINCHINLINGDITYYELGQRRDYESKLETKCYMHINEYLTEPFILNVGELDYKTELFNIKMEEVVGLFLDLEKLSENDLSDILAQRYLNSQIIPPFVTTDELSNPKFLEILDDFVLAYTSALYSKDISLEKKATLTNLLALGLPGLVGRMDISYFRDTEEYYSVHWISNPLIK